MMLKSKILNLGILIFIIIYAIYLCIINNYGWDWDTYAMLETFLDIKNNGFYSRSRGAGYLIPEIGIGFLSYYLGSFSVNFITFCFLIIGLFSFFFSFNRLNKIEKKNDDKIYLFLILCLTNHIVLRDSTISMDYSWSFMFYGLALYFLIKKQFEISIFFFSLSFGSRFNFIIFIIPTIIMVSNNYLDRYKKILFCIVITFFGSMFYVPSWLNSQFSLEFIFAEQVIFKENSIFALEEIARFVFKTIKTLGFFSLLMIVVIFFIFRKKLFLYKKNLIIIVINLILFFIFPWEQSFLWLLIFNIAYILINLVNSKIIYTVIFLNIINMFFEVDILKINYDNKLCSKTPITASLKLSLSPGLILTLDERLQQVHCYPEFFGEKQGRLTELSKYKKQVKSGKKLNSN